MSEVDDLTAEVAQLKSLFQRRLLDDKAKNVLIESVQQSLATRDEIATGDVFRDLFREALTALDRLRSEVPGQELIDSVADELLEVFARRGLSPVPTEGAMDSRYHEVIRSVPATEDYPAGCILSVERDGYTLGNRLLRPARVVVSVQETDRS